MKKLIYLILSIVAILFLTGCVEDNLKEVKVSENAYANINEERINQIICKGPIDKDLVGIDDVITSNSLKLVGEVNSKGILEAITYIYEIDFALQVKGEDLDYLRESIKLICDDKKFSTCISDVGLERAIVEAEVDMSKIKEKLDKEKFIKYAKKINESFYCIEE